LNKIQNIYCFLFVSTLYSICKGDKAPAQRDERLIMSKLFKQIGRTVDGPALISGLLALYGLVLVTQMVTGLAII
jgi:hypothetical protein